MNSGTLAVSADAQLGAAANNVTVNGGTFRVAASFASSRTFAFNSHPLMVDAGVTFTMGKPQDLEPGTFATIGGGNVATQHVRVGTLSVNGGTVAVIPGGGNAATSRITTLSLINGGKLDLADAKLIVPNTGNNAGSWDGTHYTGINGLVASGSNGGKWDGQGIITSMPDAKAYRTTIAVATANETDIAGGYFGGQFVFRNDVVLMYTYAGDANLDGQINGDDFANIDFYSHVAGANGYYKGDFNYDGTIDGDDYALIDFNVVAQAANPTGMEGPGALTAVPEPSLIVPLLAGASPLFLRRRVLPCVR